jgi:hypothetical protein
MIQYWTEHVCVGCGGAYRYKSGQSRVQRRRPKPRIAMRPCPTCGHYQPDMIAAQRFQFHVGLGFAAAAVAVSLCFVGWTMTLPEWGTTLAAAAVAVLALLAQSAILLRDPNRNPEANRQKAKRLRKLGILERLRGETPELTKEEPPRPRVGSAHAVVLVGLALGILPFLTAELVRLALGWPLNRDWYPAVIGPGDESRIYFSPYIVCLNGMWDGDARAEVLNADAAGLADGQLKAVTHHAAWGGVIHVDQKHGGGDFRWPWVDVQIPNESRLAGKELRIKTDLVVTYPAPSGMKYVNEERDSTQTVVVKLADRPGAGRVYASLCRGGTLGGALWLVLMGLAIGLAARPYRHEAFPAKVIAEDEDDVYDDERAPRPIRSRRIRDDD